MDVVFEDGSNVEYGKISTIYAADITDRIQQHRTVVHQVTFLFSPGKEMPSV